MKAFNLEEYLANPSRKVVTRDGMEARIICTDRANEDYPIIALVKVDDVEWCESFTIDGRNSNVHQESYLDLFFAPEKHEGWVNVYRDIDGLICGSVFATEEDAKCNAKTAIATVKIEWEE